MTEFGTHDLTAGISIRSDNEVLEIEMRPRPGWVFKGILCLFMAAWFPAFLSAIGSLISPTPGAQGFTGFMLFWLLGWTAGGIAVAYSMLWAFFGYERIRLSNDSLVHLFWTPVFRKKRAYDLVYVSHFRLTSSQSGNQHILPTLAFRYGDKSVKIGKGIDMDGAEDVLHLIRSRCPERVVEVSE